MWILAASFRRDPTLTYSPVAQYNSPKSSAWLSHIFRSVHIAPKIVQGGCLSGLLPAMLGFLNGPLRNGNGFLIIFLSEQSGNLLIKLFKHIPASECETPRIQGLIATATEGRFAS